MAIASLSSEFKQDIYNIFPTGSSFSGEQKNWLDSAVVEHSNEKYTELRKNYTYYSKYGQTIFDIKRDPTFNVDVQIFIAHDYMSAEGLFNSLQKNIDYKYKREINFGETGILFIKPLDVNNIKAKFYTLIKNQVFVLKITSNDGFAMMDFTDYISTSIANFIYKNIELFVLNRLRIKCTLENKDSLTHEIIVLNKKIRNLTLEGYIRDSRLNGVAGAKINFIELGLTTISDEKGHYVIRSIVGKNGEDLKFTKNFLFKSPNDEENETIKNDFYKITMKNNDDPNYTSQYILKLSMVENKTGEIFNIEKSTFELADKLTYIGKNISFIRDCSTGTFYCKQKFVGSIFNENISGTWEGSGGSGIFTGKLVKERLLKNIFLDEPICNIKTVIVKSDGNPYISNTGNLTVYNLPEEKSSLYLSCSLNREDLFFLDNAALVLYHMPAESSGDEILKIYFANFAENKLNIASEISTYMLKSTDEPHKENIDITRYLKNNLYTNQGLLIGIGSSTRSTHFFAGLNSPNSIVPKITLNQFNFTARKNTKTLEVYYCNNEADFASNSNKSVRDGSNDICINIKANGISGNISYIDFNYKGSIDFIWNTNEDDIYPSVVLVDNGVVLQSMNIKDKQMLKAYLYKPDLFDYNNKLYYSIIINGKSYEGIVSH